MDFPLSWILRSPSASERRAGLLDGGAGSFALRTCPHFRHVLTRASLVDAATQHGAFPLGSVVWIRPVSLLVRQRSGAFCSDPVPEYLAPIRLLAPLRSDLRLRLSRISHTFCDTGAIRSEKVSRCKSLTAAGQADPFRQSVFQPSAGRLMDIG